ncbi:transcription antitermination factor NusB [Phosphitispora fastidiosa]|uniref:transcription antitermination factor NusB n=1 Tax=Phosphitispora fastidiosa TaxID=2837202 RepID=UPI001E566884|nr:transcription antitermination factor NusB [Phosphitispora fastidiosa]MBU7007639.1 N utilization substance protein B [Phosphitispora fastidiosa]
MSRRAARQAALQVLFQMDIGQTKFDNALDFVVTENKLDQKQVQFIRDTISGVLEHMDALNQIINEIAVDWDMERMAGVDRSILRMALYEICYSEIPPNVAVNEAIELGKTFSTAESGKFINGILGRVVKNLDDYRRVTTNSGL